MRAQHPTATEVAKMVEAPIFHVNGDDPEAVIFVTQLALDYRKQFKCDVVVDVICYRRHGHSEADEPSVTQPVMYSQIAATPTTRELYARKLQAENVIDGETAKKLQNTYRDNIHDGKIVASKILHGLDHPYKVDWSKYRNKDFQEPIDTSVDIEQIHRLCSQIQKLPQGFSLHPRVLQIIEDRRKMASGGSADKLGFCRNNGLCHLAG